MNAVELDLIRYGMGWKSTLGKLLHGETVLCYVLEDAWRKNKIKGETCIPEGRYQLKLVKSGAGFPRLNKKYAALYGDGHHGMIEVTGVPGFVATAIHRGLNSKDTEGCPLLGTYPLMVEGEFEIRDSAKAYEAVYPTLVEWLEKGVVYLNVHRRTV